VTTSIRSSPPIGGHSGGFDRKGNIYLFVTGKVEPIRGAIFEKPAFEAGFLHL